MLFFHVGMHKTGTTFLQQAVFPHWRGINYVPWPHLELLLRLDDNKINLVSREGLSGKNWAHYEERERSLQRLAELFPASRILISFRKHSGYIPGIRPGPPTAQYLDRVLTRLTLPGSLFLAAVAIAPSLFIRYGGFSQATSRALGGTSVLIAVGVALDTMRQMESQMMMRNYEGFLR